VLIPNDLAELPCVSVASKWVISLLYATLARGCISIDPAGVGGEIRAQYVIYNQQVSSVGVLYERGDA
jgi:hypothetical protein